MTALEKLLSGKDLRSTGNCDAVISKIHDQTDFDKLFSYLFHADRIIVMHAADAIEKITLDTPQYLLPHKKELLELLSTAKNKELMWHLPLICSRLALDRHEFDYLWDILMQWVMNKSNSKLVRVGSVQGLFEMTEQKHDPELAEKFNRTMLELEKEKIPSLSARIRNIRKEMKY
jgi:hypothetical protein